MSWVSVPPRARNTLAIQVQLSARPAAVRAARARLYSCDCQQCYLLAAQLRAKGLSSQHCYVSRQQPETVQQGIATQTSALQLSTTVWRSVPEPAELVLPQAHSRNSHRHTAGTRTGTLLVNWYSGTTCGVLFRRLSLLPNAADLVEVLAAPLRHWS